MSETELYPYEAVLAFAQGKGPEFDSFMRKWREEHPKQAQPIVESLAEPIVEEKPTRKRKTTVVTPEE